MFFGGKSCRIAVSPLQEKCAEFAAGEKLTLRSLALRFLLFFFVTGPVWAVNPNKQIFEYAHTSWRTQDGALGGSPIVVTQTSDGYLWIGTNVGLVRFDGVHFTSLSLPTGERLPDPRVFSLLGAHDGSLWIGTGYSLSHWRAGHLANFPQLSGRIESIVEDSDDAVWLVRTQVTDGMGPVCRIKDERTKCFGASDGIPFASALQVANASSGGLWVVGYTELCHWTPRSCTSYFSKAPQRPETFASLKAIATGKDGSVWAAIDRAGPVLQLERFENGTWTSRTFSGITVNSSDVTTLFVDRDDALWVGTAHSGIFRVRKNQVDHFGSLDGLSSDTVGRFYQDTEGTLWIVTSEGIDSFRDLQVTTYSMREGLSAASASTVLASRDGTIWIANSHALDFLRDGKVSAIRPGTGLPGRNVTTLFEDYAGRLWVGVDDGLWVYDRGLFRTVRHPDGSALGIVFAITEDTHRDIWVRAGRNLDRIHDFRLLDESTSSQISTAYTLAANPRGGIFLGLVNGDLVQYQDGKTQTFAADEVGNARQIRDLLVEPDGSVWGTTLDEVVRWKDGMRKALTTRNGLPCDGSFAMLKDSQKSLWLYSRCGIIVIEQSQLDAWWEHPDSSVKFKLFDAFDGVQPGLTPLKPQATQSRDGRLWFVNGHILQVIDPDHLQRNLVPPPVHIEAVSADRRSYSPVEGLRLPALTRDLEIDYTALSFVAPQKVHFRYKLEGHDTNWQEPEARRQAFYNDLRPGSYRFRVIASNNDGVWNEEGAALDFSVAPAWYQTNWFLLLCVIIVFFVAWALYRLRVRQIARAISARFDERLAERTRMALDLHDTFLQTIQGSKLVADDALEKPGDLVRMRRALEQLVVWLGQATEEGRAALNSLRTSTTQRNDLAEGLRRATENGFVPSSMAVTLSVVGDAREMHPIVRDEVYRIGYEAIRNAFMHSKGSRLEVGLRYAQDLTVRIKDNGVGIDRAVADQGKDGHFGLQGMRERAARIGGKFTVVSDAVSGTEIIVVVPGRVVFRKATATPLEKVKAIFARPGRTADPD
jgi:signal transduction histidine kinase/ligand-binding sensor domain-containing protein